MSDGRTLRAVWSHWHNSQSRGEEMYMKLQSPKKRPERDHQKDPKAKKKHTRKRRSEMGKWWKRPRLDQTIPYRGLVYATRVSDELGSGTDRSFSFPFPFSFFFLFVLILGRKDIWNVIMIVFFFFSSIENKERKKKITKASSLCRRRYRPGTARSTNRKSDRSQMRFWPSWLVYFGGSVPCRFNYILAVFTDICTTSVYIYTARDNGYMHK